MALQDDLTERISATRAMEFWSYLGARIVARSSVAARQHRRHGAGSGREDRRGRHAPGGRDPRGADSLPGVATALDVEKGMALITSQGAPGRPRGNAGHAD
jgi:hypothetical protein